MSRRFSPGHKQKWWGDWVFMNEQYSALRSNVSMLGKVLGDTIKDALGENILDRVETIRKLSKSSRAGNEASRQELLTTLQNLSNDELLPVARAFSQFLNLANTQSGKLWTSWARQAKTPLRCMPF